MSKLVTTGQQDLHVCRYLLFPVAWTALSIARRVNPSAAAVRWGWRGLLPAVAIPSLMPRRNRGQQWLRFDLEAMFWFGVKVADGLGCYRDQGSALAS